MKYKIILAVAVLFLLPLSVTTVHADTVLFFAPTRVEIVDKQPVQEIRVTNMSGITRSYSIAMKNYVMNENGQTVEVDNFDYSAKRMLRFVPHQFNIKPGDQQIIRIMARFPDGTPDGQYHAHLEFLENVSKRKELNEHNENISAENRAQMNAQITYSTAIPVVISKGEIKTTIGMHDLHLGEDKNGQPEVSMILTREGNGQGNAYLEADYIAPDGKTETRASVRRSVYIYRELNKRKNSFVLDLLKKQDLQKGGQVRVKLYNRDVSEKDPIDTVLLPVM